MASCRLQPIGQDVPRGVEEVSFSGVFEGNGEYRLKFGLAHHSAQALSHSLVTAGVSASFIQRKQRQSSLVRVMPVRIQQVSRALRSAAHVCTAVGREFLLYLLTETVYYT